MWLCYLSHYLIQQYSCNKTFPLPFCLVLCSSFNNNECIFKQIVYIIPHLQINIDTFNHSIKKNLRTMRKLAVTTLRCIPQHKYTFFMQLIFNYLWPHRIRYTFFLKYSFFFIYVIIATTIILEFVYIIKLLLKIVGLFQKRGHKLSWHYINVFHLDLDIGELTL